MRKRQRMETATPAALRTSDKQVYSKHDNLTIFGKLLRLIRQKHSNSHEKFNQQDFSVVGVFDLNNISSTSVADLCCKYRRDWGMVDMVSSVLIFWLVGSIGNRICRRKSLSVSAVSKPNIPRHLSSWRNIVLIL